jgi:hypothetical protein
LLCTADRASTSIDECLDTYPGLPLLLQIFTPTMLWL